MFQQNKPSGLTPSLSDEKALVGSSKDYGTPEKQSSWTDSLVVPFRDDPNLETVSQLVNNSEDSFDTTAPVKEKAPLPTCVLHEVDHYQQRFKWDCGVSCVLMLMEPELRKYFLDNFDTIRREEGFGYSTWTIDLCYLLQRFGYKHCMYTISLGVSEKLKRHSYYDNIMNLDKDRVVKKFSMAPARGILVQQGGVCSRALRAHLARRGPAILLVDAALLACDLCKHNMLRRELRLLFGGKYVGHYILLVGYQGGSSKDDEGEETGKLLYRNPQLHPRLCATTPARLARARLAPGTDQDLILIFNNYR